MTGLLFATLDKIPVAAEVAAAFGIADNTLVQRAAPDPVNGNLVEIGDSKQPLAFFPQIKVKRWGNETNLSARLDESIWPGWDTSQPVVSTSGNKIFYTKAKFEAQWYDLGFEDDTGGFEHLVVLHEKPPINQIQWTIVSKALDFFPQGPLSADEIAEGVVRPAEYIDSIAVYHKTSRNNFIGGKNYKSGKAAHLQRIVATDANGVVAYGTQTITVNSAGNGLWTVTLPQAFLDTAAYPISVDPTFGYTSVGASSAFVSQNTINGFSATGAAGTLNSISVYSKNANGTFNIKGILVNQADKTILSGGIGAIVSSTTTAAWRTSNYASPPTIASVGYYISYIALDGSYLYYDAGSATDYWFKDTSNNYSTPTDPTDGTTTANYLISAYATYTPSGGGGGSDFLQTMMGIG